MYNLFDSITENCPNCNKELFVAEFSKSDNCKLGVACEDIEDCGFTDDLVDENGKYLYTVLLLPYKFNSNALRDVPIYENPKLTAINLLADFAVDYGDAGNRGTDVYEEMWEIIRKMYKEYLTKRKKGRMVI